MLAYFSSLREAASSAAAPASRVDPVTYDSASGLVAVFITIIIIACFCLQNVTRLLMYVELPDIGSHVHPIQLRNCYSVLHRIESVGLSLFLSRPIASCRRSKQRSGVEHVHRPGQHGDGNSKTAQRCYWLGFSRRDFR